MTTETLRPSAVATASGWVVSFSIALMVWDPACASTLGGRKGRAVGRYPCGKDMGTCGAVMRICLVYDCLFPHTVGGAERWYRSLAERLAADGHEVTYLTLRQWDRGTPHGVKGVDVRVVGPADEALLRPRPAADPAAAGVRRRGPLAPGSARPALRRGPHLLVSRTSRSWRRPWWRRPVATASSPTGLRCGAPATGRSTSDGSPGWVGSRVQRLCARVPQRAFCFSRLYARRLRDEGLRGEITMLAGAYQGPQTPRPIRTAEPLVVFAGRHIPEKQVPAIVPAIAQARTSLPELRALILGDGPERELRAARGARARPGGRHRGSRVRGHGGGRGRHRPRAVPAAAVSP